MVAVNDGDVPVGVGQDTRANWPRDWATRQTVTPVVVIGGIVSSAFDASQVVPPSLENWTVGDHEGLVPESTSTPMWTTTGPPTLPTGWTCALALFPDAVMTADDPICVVIFGTMVLLQDGSAHCGLPRRLWCGPGFPAHTVCQVALLARYFTAFGSTVTAPVRTRVRNATWSLPNAYSLLRSNRRPPAMRIFSAANSPK